MTLNTFRNHANFTWIYCSLCCNHAIIKVFLQQKLSYKADQQRETSHYPINSSTNQIIAVVTDAKLIDLKSLRSTLLTLPEIKKLANCEIPSLQPQNRVITWGFDSWIAEKVNFTYSTTIEKLCTKNQIVDHLIWPNRIDFDTFNNYCGTIGGK